LEALLRLTPSPNLCLSPCGHHVDRGHGSHVTDPGYTDLSWDAGHCGRNAIFGADIAGAAVG
jgi:hypothetical protein